MTDLRSLGPLRADDAGSGASREKSSWKLARGEPLVRGRYALKRLGGGTTCEVYLGWDEARYSLVVLKVVRPALVERERALRGLRREAETLERLSHASLVRGLDAVLDGPRPHLMLEHVEGPTLGRLLRKSGPLPMETWLSLARHLAAALHYFEREGFVHLDVKPGNVVMHSPPRLVDLGLARSVEDAARIRKPVGTDAYMSPEQCLPGIAPIGPPADVWGLGATLSHALTGRKPFPKSADDRFPQLSQEPPPGGSPRALFDVLRSCLHRDPSQRPTASKLACALEPVAATRPSSGGRIAWA